MDIFEAVRIGNTEIVNNYLKYGGSANNTIITGSTLLMIAASYGQTEAAKILIEAGADINAVNYDGMTALMWGMTVMSNPGVVKLLIEAGADVNASFSRSNSAGTTALMFAAELGLADNVKLLLEAGADINARANDGKTALERASDIGHAEVVNILKEAGAAE
jgi:ankyrin repeat protein